MPWLRPRPQASPPIEFNGGYAGSLLILAPTVVILIVFQRQFVTPRCSARSGGECLFW